MSDLNNVNITGRLVKDAELTQKANGVTICEFTVANKYDKKTGDEWSKEANFFDLAIFGKAAISLLPFLRKGQLVAIDAELRQHRWEQEGKKRKSNEIIVRRVYLLSGGIKHTTADDEYHTEEDQSFDTGPVDETYQTEEERLDLDIF